MCHRVEQKEVMGEFKLHLDYHQNDVRNVVFFQGAQLDEPNLGDSPSPPDRKKCAPSWRNPA